MDGSFITAKPNPGDFDACWDVAGVILELLDLVFLMFDDERAAQKAKYGGELFPAQLPEGTSGMTFFDFFQTDAGGHSKGILALDLETVLMIKNERQYQVTQVQAGKFEAALAHLEAYPEESSHLHPLLQKAERDALRSQMETLKGQLAEYEALRSGRQRGFHLDSFEALPRTLIQARIAAGLSQKELATRLGLKEQQIQRYEATEYASASMTRVGAVIHALGLQVREEVSFALPE